MKVLTLAAAAISVIAVATAPPAATQQSQQPGHAMPPLPDFGPSQQRDILPPLPAPAAPGTRRLQRGQSIFISRYALRGNTVLSDAELAPLLAPFAGRQVSFEELAALRDQLTGAYLERGYLTSGAVIPPQTVDDGVLEIQLVEGTLADIKVSTDGRLSPGYVRRRLETARAEPVDVNALEQQLQVLQLDPRIDNVRASLLPARVRGQSVLEVAVTEAEPLELALALDNHSSPSVGAFGSRLSLTHLNLTGAGDSLSADFRHTAGLDELSGSYAIPLRSDDTTLTLHAQFTRADVVEAPFDTLDITSRARTVGVALSRPFVRSRAVTLRASVAGEYRRSRSFLRGRPFSFSPGVERGKSTLAVLRFGQELSLRGASDAAVLRSTLSVGVDALGATRNSGDVADGQFVSWLGQLQAAHRTSWRGTLLSLRAALQLASRPLLGLELFPLGGHASVRGYRESAIARDNGAFASLEAQVPVVRAAPGWPGLDVVPFIDAGHAWSDSGDDSDETLLGAGVALRMRAGEHWHVEGSWAAALRDIPGMDGDDLQDSGLQFRAVARY